MVSVDEIAGTLRLVVGASGPTEAILELPEWYPSYAGNVSVWTPYSTAVVRNKLADTTMPFMPGWPALHYVEVGEHDDIVPGEFRHAELAPDMLAIKPFGKPRQYYVVNPTHTTEAEHPEVNST